MMNFWKHLLAPLRPHPMAAIAADAVRHPKVDGQSQQTPDSASIQTYDFTGPSNSTISTPGSAVSVSGMSELRKFADPITEETARTSSEDLEIPEDAGKRFDEFAGKWDAYAATEREASEDSEQNADDPYGTLSLSLGFGPGQDDLARNHLEDSKTKQVINEIQFRALEDKIVQMESEGLDPQTIFERTKQNVAGIRRDPPAPLKKPDGPANAEARAEFHRAAEESKRRKETDSPTKAARRAASHKKAEGSKAQQIETAVKAAGKANEEDKGPTRGM